MFRRWLNDAHTKGDIFTINPDGTRLTRVTHTKKGASTEPSPSPDGHWIVYMVIHHGDLDHGRLFKIRPNGSGETQLKQTCTGDCQGDGFPDWSSTGLILFQRTLSPSPTARTGFQAIFVMRANGTGARQVTLRSQSPTVASPYNDGAPGWSPNGRRLAFERTNNSTGHLAIFTVALTGRGLRDHSVAARRLPTAVLAARSMDRVPLGRDVRYIGQHLVGASRRDGPAQAHAHAGRHWQMAVVHFSPDGRFMSLPRTRSATAIWRTPTSTSSRRAGELRST